VVSFGKGDVVVSSGKGDVVVSSGKGDNSMTQKERYLQALNSLTARVKHDPNVIALMIYGSLAYGTVWEKSDMDVEIIVRDGSGPADKPIYLIEEEGIRDIHFELLEITPFKKRLQKVRGGFDHGVYGKGCMVFSKDDALTELFEESRKIGDDDAPRAFAAKVDGLTNWMKKAEKSATVNKNNLYAQRFLQLCAPIVAEMELIRRKENPTREAILRAQEINPSLMHEVYVIPSTTEMTEAGIKRVIKILDDYLMQHMHWWSKHVIRFLSDGEVKTCSHIFKQCGYVQLEYLAEKGVIERATQPLQIFKKSKTVVEEMAYFYIEGSNEYV